MFKRLVKILVYSFLLFLIIGTMCFYTVEKTADEFLYEPGEEIPACKAGIVLGTSQRLANGAPNLYFSYRMAAAEQLFNEGKVKVLILSGDNRVSDYNEPADMRKELMTRGLPDSCLILDFAGLRTFDSMVRCKEIFGQDSVIVVSQEFHNARAIYISEHIGLKALGYNAKKVTTQSQLKIQFREFFSRIKCLLDLYLLHTKPKHMGEKVFISL